MAVQEQDNPKHKKDKNYGNWVEACYQKTDILEINLNNEMLEEVTTFDYLDVRTSNVVC